jgi:hypothetical protein
MNDPNPHDTTQESDPRGSRWLGFGLFWLILVGGGIVSGIIASAAGMLFHAAGLAYGLAGLLPWIAPLVLAIWLANKGKTRTAQGIAFGFLSLFGVGLLLVAACFGIIAMNGGFGGWH